MAQRKLDQMNKLASALGVRGDQREGDAFNRELQVGVLALHSRRGMSGRRGTGRRAEAAGTTPTSDRAILQRPPSIPQLC